MTENQYLSGNFAPVENEHSTRELKITGTLPRELEGRLLRIGPNPVAADPGHHHWFLGNGMVHGVRLRDGRAHWYRRRFVRDDQVVAAHGGPLTPKPDGVPSDAMQGPGSAGGIANTNIIGHAGKTLAIVEAGGLPVELSDDLDTLAYSNFDGTLPAGFSAHPKRDPESGELHAAVYSLMWNHIQYVVVGRDGRVRKSVDVPTPGSPMVHDCGLTANYFLLLDFPVTFDLEVVSKGGQLPYRWNPEYGARVGLLPREGDADDVVWCEVEPCFVFHPMNAYEDADGRVVFDVVRHPRMFATDLLGPAEGPPTLERWLLDPAGGAVKEERLDDRTQEFPRHDERLVGKPYRFGYTAGFSESFEFGGLIKHDLHNRTSEVHREGAGRSFMEPVFVPCGADADEDDGWVMAYVYDAESGRSDVVILHAQDFAADPVATIHLPDRVPYGFHGNWVPDA